MKKLKPINLEEIPKADMFVLSFEADQDYYKKEKINVKNAIAEILLQKAKELKIDNLNSYTTSTITFEMEHKTSYSTVIDYLNSEFLNLFQEYPFYYTLAKVVKNPMIADYYFYNALGDEVQNMNFQDELNLIIEKLKKAKGEAKKS